MGILNFIISNFQKENSEFNSNKDNLIISESLNNSKENKSFLNKKTSRKDDNLDDNEINIVYYIIALLIGKIIWNCLYLLLIIMSLLIYPIMLRSKGLGWNIALGIVGKLLVIFVIDLTSKHDYILYFLLFVFLTLVFSNSLPSKIGSLTIDLSRDEKAKKILDKIFKESEDGELSADDGKISLMSIISS